MEVDMADELLASGVAKRGGKKKRSNVSHTSTCHPGLTAVLPIIP